MPKNKDLKRLVRARMQKTGESYTTSRAQIVRKGKATRGTTIPVARYAEVAGMSDEAVADKTGRTWRQWVKILDLAGAVQMPHREIAKLLHEQHDVPKWWAQTVTVAYERIRGLREVGQRRGGGFDVNKSKTVPVPIAELYRAFGARHRAVWLPGVEITVRKATREKSMRLRYEDRDPVDVHFWAKGPQKSQVQLQHRQLASKAAADEMRAFWTDRLAALAAMLR